MAITTLQQATEVTGVGTTTLSEVVRDEPNDVYVRELKVLGDPVSGVRPLMFTLRLTAPTAEALAFVAPIQTF
jgi:hypothetical protein